jgi:hypothetical protein
LPVMVPEQSKCSRRQMALDTWGRWVTEDSIIESDRNEIKQNLLDYCKLDTFAMVEIYRVLSIL